MRKIDIARMFTLYFSTKTISIAFYLFNSVFFYIFVCIIVLRVVITPYSDINNLEN